MPRCPMFPAAFVVLAVALGQACGSTRPDLPAAAPAADGADDVVGGQGQPSGETLAVDENEPEIKRPYRIGPGDVIRIDTWNADAVFNQTHAVGPDGAITIAIYGVVDVDGRTRQELAEQLTEILKQDYKDPKVTITVIDYKNAKFFVFGEVNQPGAHTLAGSPFLLDAITLAGGLRVSADPTQCSVIRGNNAMVKVNLMRLFRRGERNLNVKVGVGDVIYVPRNSERVIHVLGEVRRPGTFPIPYDEDFNLVSAILLAGSYTPDAALGTVNVIRGDPAHPTFIEVSVSEILDGKGGNIALQAGDIVYVSQRTMAKVNYFIRQVTPALSQVFFAEQLTRTVENFGTPSGN